MAQLKPFREKRCLECFDYRLSKFFSRISWQNKFESKQAGLTFEFNESLSGFEMLVPDGKKIPFTRDK
jgi:hypothetical protein